jgi:chitin deacetylase
MWNITAYDWNSKGTARIEDHVARQVRGGDVILLHDGGHRGIQADRSQTIMATGRMVPRYRDLGFSFVTVPEMMAGVPK